MNEKKIDRLIVKRELLAMKIKRMEQTSGHNQRQADALRK